MHPSTCSGPCLLKHKGASGYCALRRQVLVETRQNVISQRGEHLLGYPDTSNRLAGWAIDVKLLSLLQEHNFNAARSLTQPLLDCILYLTQHPYDPGTLPSSANQCILGNVYLRSNLSRKLYLRSNLSRKSTIVRVNGVDRCRVKASMTGERRQQSDVLSCYVCSQPACIYASTEVWIHAKTRVAAVACAPVRSLILNHNFVCRSFLTRKSGGRKPYELLSHSGSAYAPLFAPKRMGVVLSLLAHLKSSALHAIKGYTPQGTVGGVV